MAEIGYHASHEQFSPSALLGLVQVAQHAGFTCAMSSDHFKPWGPSQGHSGFAWSWLGAAMQASTLPFGIISAPGYRYHPAIIAQAAASLCDMFPGRLWLALGSGQRLNEDITGIAWPDKGERNARLAECAHVIRDLLDGREVTHHGRIHVVGARIYSLPEVRPRLLGAAVTEETAKFVGAWADGLLTVNAAPEKMKRVIEAFRRGGGERKPLYLQVSLNWACTDTNARAGAHEQWRYNALGGEVNWELRSPEDFDTATRFVSPDQVCESVLVSADLDQHVEWLGQFIELGFDQLLLHQVGRNQIEFIEAFGTKVLPQLKT